jgi:AAA domain
MARRFDPLGRNKPHVSAALDAELAEFAQDSPIIRDMVGHIQHVPKVNGHAPDDSYIPLGEPSDAPQKRFELIPFDKIKMPESSEWRIKKLFPKCGVGLFYGQSMTLKSFLAVDSNLHIAIGWNWAARTVTQAPAVYIAAEGAAGVRKRKIGFELHHAEHLPEHVPFFLIETAPNLGTGQDDLHSRFNCFVLIIHHSGLADDDRPRGHSSLKGALDVLIRFERKEGTQTAT